MDQLIGELMKNRKIRDENHKNDIQNTIVHLIKSISEVAVIPEHKRLDTTCHHLIGLIADLGFIWDTSLRNTTLMLVQDAVAQPVEELPDDDWYFQACKAFLRVYENRKNPPPMRKVIRI